jgi:hypothetical protein
MRAQKESSSMWRTPKGFYIFYLGIKVILLSIGVPLSSTAPSMVNSCNTGEVS